MDHIVAGILRLHREETYHLPEGASADNVVESEMARRTFWMLESTVTNNRSHRCLLAYSIYLGQDNLHSGLRSPAAFTLSDITTLLPCEENDFAFGVIPSERAALAGTAAAAANPALTFTQSRSLFATLIQAHSLWGQVARRASHNDREQAGVTMNPWEESSEYAQLSNALRQWERDLPGRHRWSVWNLRGYKAESLHLVGTFGILPKENN
jgi:hypothetical protein